MQIEKLDDVAGTLEELWVSYNQISTLDGLSGLTNLTTLYISNNLIKSWAELDKLAALPNLKDVLFVGNPIYDESGSRCVIFTFFLCLYLHLHELYLLWGRISDALMFNLLFISWQQGGSPH